MLARSVSLLAALASPVPPLPTNPLPAAAPEGAEASETTPAPEASPSAIRSVWEALKLEAGRYGSDSLALLRAPLSWDARDRRTAAGFALLLGGLMLADEQIDRQAQRTRSDFTDRVSAATTSLGGGNGVKLSAALLVGGLLLRDRDLRDTGRDAIEAGVLALLLQKYVFKPAFGRERPGVSDGETVFRPYSGNDSFPSGHATEAFAVASVVAMRAKGWVIPSLAYAAATVVAFDRVNDRVHFASDVFAGAALGTTVGRFLVRRHTTAQAARPPPAVSLEVVPVRGGIAARLVF